MAWSLLAALLASLLAMPVAAQTSTTSTTLPKARVLYTTAAVPNRVEGFCLGPNGGMALRPVFQEETVENPRRLLIPNKPDGSAGDVLYVAGRHKVESFLIKTNGGLESIGTTKKLIPEDPDPLQNANPLDIAVDPARTHVYVPNRRANRIEAYALDIDTGGILPGVMTSCARVHSDVTLQDLEVGVSNGTHVLYVSEATSQFVAGKKGRVDVFQLSAEGELPDLYNEIDDPEGASRCGNPDATTTSTTTSTSSTSLTTLTTTVSTTTTTTTVDTRFTETLSTRKKMRGPASFVLSDVDADGVDDYLYVYDIYARRVIEFGLTDGLFDPDDEEQSRIGATNELGRLLDLIAFEGPGDPAERTLLGAADNQGRVRTFALKPDENGAFTKVPGNPRLRQTNKIFDATPVRIVVGIMDSSAVLYVPGGEANRIHAYRIVSSKKGFFPEAKAFSSTEKRQSTFPNDAAVAQIQGACPCHDPSSCP